MDGNLAIAAVLIGTHLLDQLMPLHVSLSPTGQVARMGPTLVKLAGENRILGRHFFDVFDVHRPSGITQMADLALWAGQRLHLHLRDADDIRFRGLAFPLEDGTGTLINLSLGVGVVEAVQRHNLTIADFAATDLTVELLYLVEAKTAVGQELRNLNLRLQGAKVMAEEQALTDTLTGLRNRRALDLTLNAFTSGAVPFALMNMDLDYFKSVNDTLGHAAGDHVLREVAKVLIEETRVGDTVARVGGDEFVIVLPSLVSQARLLSLAACIIDRLSVPMDFEGQACRISASIGITISVFYDHPDADRMAADADTALYASKHAGRAQACMFDRKIVDENGSA